MHHLPPSSTPAPSLAVLIPIYKPALNDLERLSLRYALDQLANRKAIFFGPSGLALDWYRLHFPQVDFQPMDPVHFASIPAYSKLLLRRDFYQAFAQHDWLLILQPDAIVLRDALDDWTSRPIDYVGAPWPKPWKLHINVARFAGAKARKIEVSVGNGGLSLRRTAAVLDLLEQFSDVAQISSERGIAEDLFFGIAGVLAEGFRVPTLLQASGFAMEFTPEQLLRDNGGVHPMGGHAWWARAPQFWLALIDADRRAAFAQALALAP